MVATPEEVHRLDAPRAREAALTTSTQAVVFSPRNQAPNSNFIQVCANKAAFEECYPCQTCDIQNEDYFDDFSGDVTPGVWPSRWRRYS